MNACRILLIAFFMILFQGEVNAQDPGTVIDNSDHTEAFWSVTVRDSDGNILFSRNSDKLIIPASNQKLYTLGAALFYLGSDFRFETPILSEGYLQEGTWHGDVVIQGKGDPSISGFLYDNDRYHVFSKWLDQLRKKGIERVQGDLVGDVSYFDDQVYPKGWDWYDLSFYYGVEIAPLSFNNNAVDLEVFADGRIGEAPRITWFPDSTDYVQFINEQEIVPANLKYDEYYRRDPGTNRIILRSTLPKGYYEEESLSIENAGLYFVDAFKDYSMQEGLSWKGNRRVSREAAVSANSNSDTLAVHRSKPLAELVAWANKESDNFYTEMLLKTIDAEINGTAGSFEGGVQQVRNYLHAMGIDTSGVIMRDGSGLAYGNLSSTSALSKYLVNIQEEPFFNDFYRSLPVAGIDGTIAHRMKGSPLYNNFRGKTGYMSGVRTLTGYMRTASGEEVIVSIATNNFAGKVKPIDRTHEEILMYLYQNF